jgi:hypothetical protein
MTERGRALGHRQPREWLRQAWVGGPAAVGGAFE